MAVSQLCPWGCLPRTRLPGQGWARAQAVVLGWVEWLQPEPRGCQVCTGRHPAFSTRASGQHTAPSFLAARANCWPGAHGPQRRQAGAGQPSLCPGGWAGLSQPLPARLPPPSHGPSTSAGSLANRLVCVCDIVEAHAWAGCPGGSLCAQPSDCVCESHVVMAVHWERSCVGPGRSLAGTWLDRRQWAPGVSSLSEELPSGLPGWVQLASCPSQTGAPGLPSVLLSTLTLPLCV